MGMVNDKKRVLPLSREKRDNWRIGIKQVAGENRNTRERGHHSYNQTHALTDTHVCKHTLTNTFKEINFVHIFCCVNILCPYSQHDHWVSLQQSPSKSLCCSKVAVLCKSVAAGEMRTGRAINMSAYWS